MADKITMFFDAAGHKISQRFGVREAKEVLGAVAVKVVEMGPEDLGNATLSVDGELVRAPINPITARAKPIAPAET